MDAMFTELRNSLDAVMKSRTKDGLGLQKRRADEVVTHQHKARVLRFARTTNPQLLLDTLIGIFQIGLNYALRSGQEHKNLTPQPTENG